ncbi:DDB1- and CUL4-associated factor 15 [Lampetra fluviatilis]
MAPPVVSRRRRCRTAPGLVQRLALIPITGRIPRLLFRALPSRLCRPLGSIVSEGVMRQGHVFLGFSKCGRFLLSYTRRLEEIDATATALYVYDLYWWGFSLSRPLQQVCRVRLFGDTPACSDLFLSVCEWPSDPSQIMVYGISTVISDLPLGVLPSEDHRDVFITIAASPPLTACAECSSALPTGESGLRGRCRRHGYLVNFHYQVVFPFPGFQPSVQLGCDRILVLNTSYSLLACAVSLTEEAGSATPGLLYQQAETKPETQRLRSPGRPAPRSPDGLRSSVPHVSVGGTPLHAMEEEGDLAGSGEDHDPGVELGGVSYSSSVYSLARTPSLDHSRGGRGSSYDEDMKPGLPVSVTDFALRQGILVSEAMAQRAMCVRVEQLTLDLEDVISASIASHAPWSDRFCSFTDYDAVVLQVCPDTASVLLMIGLILLAFPVAPQPGTDRCPRTHHASMFIRWSLSTGRAETIGVEGMLHEVEGRPSSVVWRRWRKSCAELLIKWTNPVKPSQAVTRLTNQAVHTGCSLKVLLDGDRCRGVRLGQSLN